MLALKKERCQKCRVERQIRFCLRIGKGLGYYCCNKLRADLKCPSECNYSPCIPGEGEALFPSCKVDSHTEFVDFMRLITDRWIHNPLPQLHGKTAYEMAAENPEAMLDFLMQFKIPSSFPLDYLLKRLNITTQTPLPTVDDPESVTKSFFNHIITREWNNLYSFYGENKLLPEAGKYLVGILRGILALTKCKAFSVINCGLSEDQATAYVYLELNGKTDWTVVLRKVDDKWIIKQQIMGSPRDYFAQNDLFTQVATEMAKGEFEKAEKTLYRIKDIYPDTADIYYYYGIYHQWTKEIGKACEDFTRAVALDSDWVMPQLHLGLIYMAERKYDLALAWFKNADRIEPDNPVVLNNLGACLYGMGEKEKAKEIWHKALALQPDFTPVVKNLDLINQDV